MPKIFRNKIKELFRIVLNPDDIRKNELGACVMIHALAYWHKETGLTKLDLAQKSGIWKIYTSKKGFKRTQTLDKYMNFKTFPAIPRWNRVIQTVEFVLSSGTSQSFLRKSLEKYFKKLRSLK